MPRLINPVNWELDQDEREGPLVTLKNNNGHKLHIHPISSTLVRVLHTLPQDGRSGVKLRNHRDLPKAGRDGIVWEKPRQVWETKLNSPSKSLEIWSTNSELRIQVDYSHAITLSWYHSNQEVAFLRDFKHAYTFDAVSRKVYHLVDREQYMPLSEHAPSANQNHPAHPQQNEFLYGLGETKGTMSKGGKRYLIDGRDSLGCDPEETDPLYKLTPFYLTFNKASNFWHGIYYNTLNPSIFDFGAEHDFSTGNFRSFSTEHGPLDYYVIIGDAKENSLPSIISQFSRLVTPHLPGVVGNLKDQWQASPVLPNLNQFGYLASSLTLSERKDAQSAVIDYVREAKEHKFPIDGMHLSSGYCQDPKTGERNYFTWTDKEKYPDPSEFGRTVEKELESVVIINVKPWLLESHPWYEQAARARAFVGAAPDCLPTSSSSSTPQEPDRCGEQGQSRTLHWSVNMGETAKGSYLDFSSPGYLEWQRFMREGVLKHGTTGFWIDNNEFSTLIDDEETFEGERDFWSLSSELQTTLTSKTFTEDDSRLNSEVSSRLGWGGGKVSVGAVGRASQTMGMAKATFECLLTERPNDRPVVVTRSAVPGMQSFALATWSGDNSTTWKALKWSTKMTLSVGLSFGCGLYGHDIGGFAGAHSPSAELLIRWCQQAAFHTRFTVHSWKQISTTLWMYDHLPGVTDTLRAAVDLHYRLAPMLYSFYVTHYHRNGWPVLKPLLWFHSSDFTTLTQDEQFYVGTHLLVAPALDFGAKSVTFNLPLVIDSDLEKTPASFCEIDTGVWHLAGEAESKGETGREVTLDAPLERCPALMRSGGLLCVSGPVGQTIFSTRARSEREFQLFPLPRSAPSSTSECQSDVFTLVECDGKTNDATIKGTFNEIDISYLTDSEEPEIVRIKIEPRRTGYAGEWKWSFSLPLGDQRKLALEEQDGDSICREIGLLKTADGTGRLEMEIVVDTSSE